MTKTETAKTLAVTLLMVGGGIAHFVSPESFLGFVFSPLPPIATVYVTGAIQIAIGLAVLLPRFRSGAGLAFALLCLAYLPLHVWDLFRDDPMITPFIVAVVRLPIQLGFIWIGWSIWKSRKPSEG